MILPQLSLLILILVILILNYTSDIIGESINIIHLLMFVIIVKLNTLPLRLILHDLRVILFANIYLSIFFNNSLLKACLHLDLIRSIHCLLCALD